MAEAPYLTRFASLTRYRAAEVVTPEEHAAARKIGTAVVRWAETVVLGAQGNGKPGVTAACPTGGGGAAARADRRVSGGGTSPQICGEVPVDLGRTGRGCVAPARMGHFFSLWITMLPLAMI